MLGIRLDQRPLTQAYLIGQTSAILIENTANGPALIERAKRFGRYNVIAIVPSGLSKIERLRRHIRVILDGHVHLRHGGDWVSEYIEEMSEFPSGLFDDQVDATTQYLEYNVSRANAHGTIVVWDMRREFLTRTASLPPAGQTVNWRGAVCWFIHETTMVRRTAHRGTCNAPSGMRYRQRLEAPLIA